LPIVYRAHKKFTNLKMQSCQIGTLFQNGPNGCFAFNCFLLVEIKPICEYG